MSLPTLNDVQAIEPILSNMLLAYMQDDNRFVASRVFPPVPVSTDSGTYYIASKKYWFHDDLARRAPGSPFAQVNYGLETTTYKTQQWAASWALADEVRANNLAPMDLEQAAVRKLAQSSLIRKEVGFATDFMVTGVWGTDNTTATNWSDFSAGDPVKDFLLASRTISNNTGQMANTMVMGFIVYDALVNHPDIVDRMKHVQVASMGALDAVLASVFGVDRFLVARASYSNTNEAAAFSATAIIDDDCLVCHVNPSAGILDVTAGKTFVWGPGGGIGSLYRYRSQAQHTDLIQHKEQWDQKAVATDLGYFFSDIVD